MHRDRNSLACPEFLGLTIIPVVHLFWKVTGSQIHPSLSIVDAIRGFKIRDRIAIK